jgi:predicted nuclease of predicted toxin-antitoxin system
MRILLDHCIPASLAKDLTSHFVRTARQMGWDTLSNGKLLLAASKEFDVLLTVDSNMRYQQNADLPISVIALRVFDNRHRALVTLLPEIEEILSKLIPCHLYEIGPRAEK